MMMTGGRPPASGQPECQPDFLNGTPFSTDEYRPSDSGSKPSVVRQEALCSGRSERYPSAFPKRRQLTSQSLSIKSRC